MKRICLACDLIDDAEKIRQYKIHHSAGQVWPGIVDSIREAGIRDMEIYCTGNRLMMIIEVDDGFQLDRKAELDSQNKLVGEWEKLMSAFQQPVPWAIEGEKWVQMERIYKLGV